jgi:hypothetical protein
MALPVAPPPPSDDVAVHNWAGISVQVAWTLLTEGVKVHGQVLRDLRAHAILHLDEGDSAPAAEDRAAMLTEGFVRHARGKMQDPWPQDREMPLSPRWRRAVDASLSQLSAVVFRQHYGNRRKLEHLTQMLQVDRLALETARAGLRETLRRVARTDGLPLDRWEPERIDRLLRRLAAYSPGPCPPTLDVVEGAHADHVRSCARCDRAVRLVQAGVIETEDLLPPTLGARETSDVKVLALHFHPEARMHRELLAKELPVASVPVGDDILLVDASQLERVTPMLETAAEVGRPRREMLRGAVVSGPGRFSAHGLLGPLGTQGSRDVLARRWGEVDGVGELPAVVPPPPSAWPAWVGVAILSAATVALLVGVTRPGSVDGPTVLQAEFVNARGGVWTSFDVPEEAYVGIVTEQTGHAAIELPGKSIVGKGAIATGDGRYRIHLPAQAVLVVASSKPLTDLPLWLAQVESTAQPLDSLAAQLSQANGLDFALHRRP